jgi:peroxiredoxin
MKIYLKTIAVVTLFSASLISCNDKESKTEVAKNENVSTEKISEVKEGKLDMQIRDGKIIKGYGIGDEATDFKLKDVDGKMVSMSDYKDAKGFIVIFTCNTCPFAVASESRIVALDKAYKEKGYPVIALNPNDPKVQPDDTYEFMQAKAKSAGFSFPYLYDAHDKVYAAYGATKTPHVYLLQKSSSKLIVKYIGAIDDNVRKADAVKETFLANAIDALLEGKEIEKKETKAIGCSIKV